MEGIVVCLPELLFEDSIESAKGVIKQFTNSDELAEKSLIYIPYGKLKAYNASLSSQSDKHQQYAIQSLTAPLTNDVRGIRVVPEDHIVTASEFDVSRYNFTAVVRKAKEKDLDKTLVTKTPGRDSLPYYYRKQDLAKFSATVKALIEDGYIASKVKYLPTNKVVVTPLAPKGCLVCVNSLEQSYPEKVPKFEAIWQYYVHTLMTSVNHLRMTAASLKAYFAGEINYLNVKPDGKKGEREWKPLSRNPKHVNQSNTQALLDMLTSNSGSFVVKRSARRRLGNIEVNIMFDKMLEHIHAYSKLELPVRHRDTVIKLDRDTVVNATLNVRPGKGDSRVVCGKWTLWQVPVYAIAHIYGPGTVEINIHSMEFFKIGLMSRGISPTSMSTRDQNVLPFKCNAPFGSNQSMTINRHIRSIELYHPISAAIGMPIMLIGMKGSGKSTARSLIMEYAPFTIAGRALFDDVFVELDEFWEREEIVAKMVDVWNEKGNDMTYNDLKVVFDEYQDEFNDHLSAEYARGRMIFLFDDICKVQTTTLPFKTWIVKTPYDNVDVILNRNTHNLDKMFEVKIAELYAQQIAYEPIWLSDFIRAYVEYGARLSEGDHEGSLTIPVALSHLEDYGWSGMPHFPHVTYSMLRFPAENKDDHVKFVQALIDRTSIAATVTVTNEPVYFDTPRGRVTAVKVYVSNILSEEAIRELNLHAYSTPNLLWHMSIGGGYMDYYWTKKGLEPPQPVIGEVFEFRANRLEMSLFTMEADRVHIDGKIYDGDTDELYTTMLRMPVSDTPLISGVHVCLVHCIKEAKSALALLHAFHTWADLNKMNATMVTYNFQEACMTYNHAYKNTKCVMVTGYYESNHGEIEEYSLHQQRIDAFTKYKPFDKIWYFQWAGKHALDADDDYRQTYGRVDVYTYNGDKDGYVEWVTQNLASIPVAVNVAV